MADRSEAVKRAAAVRARKRFEREMHAAWSDAGFPADFEYKGEKMSVLPEVAEHWRMQIKAGTQPINPFATPQKPTISVTVSFGSVSEEEADRIVRAAKQAGVLTTPRITKKVAKEEK